MKNNKVKKNAIVLDGREYLTSKEAAEVLSIPKVTLYKWIDKEYFQDIVRKGNKPLLPVSSVEFVMEQIENEKKMLSIAEVEELLQISSFKIFELMKESYLVKSFNSKRYLLPLKNYHLFLKEHGWLMPFYQNGTIPEGFYSAKMLTERYHERPNEIQRWIRQGRFRDVLKIGATSRTKKVYLVPEESVIQYETFIEELTKNFITADEAANVLRVGKSTIGNWVNKDLFLGAVKWLNTWYIPLTEVEKTLLEISAREKLQVTKKATKPEKPKGYLTVKELSKELNYPIGKVRRLISNNELGTPFQFVDNGIRLSAISPDALQLYKDKISKLQECFKTKDAARYLGNLKPQTVSVYAKEGYFPNAIIEKGSYYIPQCDLDEFKKLRELSIVRSKKDEKVKKSNLRHLTKKELLDELLKTLNNYDVPQYLLNTKQYYIEYVLIRISALNGHVSYIKSECSRAKKCFENIISKLPEECFLITDEKIQDILSDHELAVTHRILANWFFQYVYSKVGNENDKKSFIIQPSSSRGSDEASEVYSPEIYLEYISHSKKIEMHIPEAIRSQYYANMWLFTIMHLIDTWRATDVVNSLPNIDLDGINVDGLEWFLNNELSKEQAQIIINQAYLEVQGSVVSKTNALLTFLVPPEFVLPTGNAFVICELHRRQNEQKYLLDTLVTSNHKARKPNQKHLKFFKENTILSDFKSLAMNRTTMTYLFNSIVSVSPDPELALTYTQHTRSHETESATAIYVNATNYDGSIGTISLNLFNRGHFGWIYDTLIKLMFEDTDITLSMSERSKYIMDFRKDFSPTQLENWGIFLQKIENKKDVILQKLHLLSYEAIKDLVGSIFKGEMPSREEQGQCLTHPNCENPHLKSCFSCEYFIPQVYVVVHIKHEMDRLFSSLESTNNQTIMKRDSHFLKVYLLLLNEAISVFGKSYIESLIDIKEIRRRVLMNSQLLI